MSAEPLTAIRESIGRLPDALLDWSGSAFYSGREAFSGVRPIYILGLNPGGSPERQPQNTVRRHIEEFWARSSPWSAYADDSWEGAPPGTWGMQPRVLHLLKQLSLNPQLTPASNVVFVRSNNEAALSGEKSSLLDACWPVHDTIIRALKTKVVVCFGGTAGRWVRERLDAKLLIDSYREQNARGWTSEAHQAHSGVIVATVTHPGRANWLNPASDPTPMIARCLAAVG